MLVLSCLPCLSPLVNRRVADTDTDIAVYTNENEYDDDNDFSNNLIPDNHQIDSIRQIHLSEARTCAARASRLHW